MKSFFFFYLPDTPDDCTSGTTASPTTIALPRAGYCTTLKSRCAC